MRWDHGRDGESVRDKTGRRTQLRVQQVRHIGYVYDVCIVTCLSLRILVAAVYLGSISSLSAVWIRLR